MLRKSLSVILVVLLLSGCTTSSPNHGASPVPQSPPTLAQEAIRKALAELGILLPEGLPRVFATPLKPVPQGFAFLVATAYEDTLYLTGLSNDYGEVKVLDKLPRAVVNTAKLEISGDQRSLTIWSQAPFRASSLTVTGGIPFR